MGTAGPADGPGRSSPCGAFGRSTTVLGGTRYLPSAPMSSVLPGLAGPPTSERLPSAALDFDLTTEAVEEQTGERRSAGPFVAVYAGMGGVLVILGALGLLGLDPGVTGLAAEGMLIGGAAIAATATFAVFYMGSGMPVRLHVDDVGVTLTRRNGKAAGVRWDDRDLRIDLLHFSGDKEKVLPRSDARYRRPFWVDVWTTKSRYSALETTLPEEGFDAILERARARGVKVFATRVSFYWHSAPKSPGWLAYDEEAGLAAGRVLNGEVNKLRGPDAPIDGS